MSKIKRVFALLLAVTMAVGCTGCDILNSSYDAYGSIPESTGGKDIQKSAAADNVFSLNSNSEYSLNPIIATNHANQLICCLVYENMLELDNDFNIIEGEGIIESWETNEDATSWVFTLEEGHIFHDGTPVTAKDLRESIERCISYGTGRFRGRFGNVTGVSYGGDRKLYVSLANGDSQFMKLLNIPVIKKGTFPDKHPIGSGPYTYNEDFTMLVAFEGYEGYEDLPVDKVYIKEYTDPAGIIDAFEDSLIDVVINDPSSLTNLGYASTNEVHTFSTTNMHYICFNEESVLGKYDAFRYAMQFAFDRAYLVDLLNLNAVASPLPIYPTCDFYPKQLADSLNYDLDTCVRILENAGIRDYDGDGKLEYMSGSPQKFELKLLVCSDSSAKAGIARRFQSDMASIGITVNVEEKTWSNYMTALEDGDFDMYYAEIKLRNDFDISMLVKVPEEDETGYLNYTRSTDDSYLPYVRTYLSSPKDSREVNCKVMCDYITSRGKMVVIGFEKQQIISHRGVVKGIDANLGNPLYGFKNWVIDLS